MSTEKSAAPAATTAPKTAALYGGTDRRAERDTILLYLRDARSTVELLQDTADTWRERERDARELLASAEEALAGPPHMEITPVARYDKKRAEKAIVICHEHLTELEDRIQRLRVRMAAWEQQLRNIPVSELRGQEHLEDLQRRVRFAR